MKIVPKVGKQCFWSYRSKPAVAETVGSRRPAPNDRVCTTVCLIIGHSKI